MRYFEFTGNNAPYYALIGCEDECNVIDLYEEYVCKIEIPEERDNRLYKEITRDKAISEWIKASICDMGDAFNVDNVIMDFDKYSECESMLFLMED